MTPIEDPYWQATADHIRTLGVPVGAVLAPPGFESLLPGCRSSARSVGPDAEVEARPAALVVHKGMPEPVSAAILLHALDHQVISFANEVFMVFSEVGEVVGPDNIHVIPRGRLLAAALEAYERKAMSAPASAPQPPPLPPPPRMAATYMGDGRVLLQTIYGHLMLVNGSDTGIVPHLIRDGWFDRNITDIIFRLLEPGMTFIDIGANCGTYAVLGAAKVERSGRAIAIEASPRLAHLLQETIDLNGLTGHCDVLSCAAGAEPGKLVLHQMANRQGGSTLLKDIAERAASGLMGESLIATEVEVRTLDDIIAERDITRIDLIKIDVEGFEYEVLQGARATLHRFRPRMILEWHNAFFEGRQEVARALYDYLTVELGYQLHRIEQGATTRPVTLDDLRHGHADVIAEPPS